MANSTSTLTPAKSPYTLSYGMRLDRGTAPEFGHPEVPCLLPDGSQGRLTLHVINGTQEEIKTRLLESIDAFFELQADADQ